MTYTVQKGDTLSAIGSRLGVDWHGITGYRSGNPNLIYVGELLTVPDKTSGGTTAAPKTTTVQKSSAPQPSSNTAATKSSLPTITTGTIPSGSDINPQTGKAYAVNPASGVWDDNYYNNVVVPAFKKQLSDIGLTSDEAKILSGVSVGNYSDYENKALAELTPYYEKLLKESNYDLDLAKTRLDEDYQRGLRVARKESDVDTTAMMTETVPQEQRNVIGELNKMGVLTTREAPAPAQKMKLSTGDELAYSRPVGFGGQAGVRLSELRTSQQARQDAIARALANAEEESGVTHQRGVADIALEKSRKASELEQKKRESVPTLASSQWNRALQEAALKRDIILQRTGGGTTYV